MTQEDEKLLLKDLCARLPYGVKCYNRGTETIFILSDISDTDSDFPTFDYGFADIDEIKPYLRPMSSMTEEEKEEYCKLQDEVLYSSGRLVTDNINDMVDWFNAHHFDYRGLIERGLAIDCTNLNIY